jgi:hypothetical protein
MKRCYWIMRATGYAAGLLGVALFLLGRDPDLPGWLRPAGAALLGLSFAAFLAGYILYLLFFARRAR